MPANSFSKLEGYGLFIMLVAPSSLATNLNNRIQARGATLDSINAYFLASLAGAPYSLAGKIDITKFQGLWTDSSGNLAAALDQNPADVLRALVGTAFDYTDPPCPDDATQQLIWAQLLK
jgi:hypothetical protein